MVLPLLLSGVRTGEVRTAEDGCVRAVCARREDGLYRAYLEGEEGRALIGVLEPRDARMTAQRRFSREELAALGSLRCGRAVCSFLFGQDGWGDPPPRFFGDERLERARKAVEGARFRRTGERRELALPYAPDAPFPLEELFCLARIQSVCGRLCAVYCVDGDGRPIF